MALMPARAAFSALAKRHGPRVWRIATTIFRVIKRLVLLCRNISTIYCAVKFYRLSDQAIIERHLASTDKIAAEFSTLLLALVVVATVLVARQLVFGAGDE
jgi:hypothetical protein